MMRIITGKARGTRLATLEGEMTRPTAERVKEAVFSMIQFDIEGREVLDLFAGSGQLGLEALSRGAAYATLVDNSNLAIEVIKKNADKARLIDSCRLIYADYSEALRRMQGEVRYDLVFLDPPYRGGHLVKALDLLSKYDLLKPTSTIICESLECDILSSSDACERYQVIKTARYGTTYVNILKYNLE